MKNRFFVLTLALFMTLQLGAMNASAMSTVSGEKEILSINIGDSFDDTGNDIKEQLIKTEYSLKKDDLVVVISEGDTYYEVLLPYGDLPYIRGKIDKQTLTFDSSSFNSANQAHIEDTMVFGNTVSIAVENPERLSLQAIRISSTPRFLSSLHTVVDSHSENPCTLLIYVFRQNTLTK